MGCAFLVSTGETHHANELRQRYHAGPAAVQASQFRTALADPPWQFDNRTGKVAPEHQRLRRYRTMTLDEIRALNVARVMAPTAHLYLWCPTRSCPTASR